MKRRLLFHVAFVSFAYYFSNALYMVRGLLLARLLGPTVFGVWTGMRMVQTLSAMAHLGSRQGMTQLAPLAEGEGRLNDAARLTQTASGLALLTALPFSLVVVGIGLTSTQWRLEWIVFALAMVAIQLFDFINAFFRSKQRFHLVGTGQVLVALLTTVLGLGAAWRFGLIGFLVVIGVAYAATLLVLWRIGPAYPAPTLDRDAASRLLAVGFPLMTSGALFTLLWNVDKLLLWIIRGSESLGVYAVQSSFTNAALLAPTALSTVLHPHLMRHLGETRTPRALRPYLVRGGEIVATWSAPIAGLGFVLLHLPIRWWLARYTPAIEPGRVLMLAAFFSMTAAVPMVVVAALNGQRWLCLIRFVAIIVAVAVGIVGLRYGYVGLALAMSFALLVDSLWTQLEAMRRTKMRSGEAVILIARLYWPFVLLLLSVWLAWQLIPQVVQTWQADVLITSVRATIAVLPSAAWAVWRTRRLRLFH